MGISHHAFQAIEAYDVLVALLETEVAISNKDDFDLKRAAQANRRSALSVARHLIGRYDTPDHELYSSIMAEHEHDFHNNFVKSPQALVGPREPWHDIHSKVEGPIAQDVFTNFFERWRKQCKNETRLDPLNFNLIDLNCLPPFTGMYIF